jgi:DNA-binding LacI/PurR family transcriptional regulator
MVRLVDIARQAGVSAMTVSRVLRDSPEISAVTKARIRAIADRLGYLPDISARGLRTRTTRLLGALVPSLSDPSQARLVQALEDRVHNLGYDLLLGQSANQPDREDLSLRRFIARRVDGVFLTPVYRPVPRTHTYDELRHRGVRVVLLGPMAVGTESFAQVECLDEAATHQATTYLLSLGHQRIAFLSGPVHSPTAQARVRGYRRALSNAGIDPDDRLVFHAGSTADDGARAASQLLDENPGATALQAVNDSVALGAAQFLLGQGLTIPGDIAVVGFGDIPAAEFFRVPLTTLRPPHQNLAAAAVEVMLKLVKGEAAAARRFPVELVLRASTGPPARAVAAPVVGSQVQ